MIALPTSALDKVDINTADVWTLARVLKGVGPKKAAAIVEFRKKNGPFKSLYDLDRVYGIGQKTIEKNKDKIAVSIPENRTQLPEHTSTIEKQVTKSPQVKDE